MKRGKRLSEKSKQELKAKLEEEIETLTKRVIDEAPNRGYAPPLHQKVAFRVLPISETTLRGLDEAKPPFTIMTDIQNACIPHALAGRDILGAARTGSGKSLAFLIPLLETLYRHRFTPQDGPGGIVLSPTRELAVQIFQVLQAVGKYHSFSVGLLIGGKKDFYQEQQQVGTTNIIIATPGRLLQHLEQTPYFETNELKMLILDEADRILDMGFRDQLVRILDYIPGSDQRQTLLFSATQTKDVSHLATLSLSKPEYLGVHDKEKNSTPDSLQQSYVIVPLEHKLNAIYSFIKSHLKSKCIVFMASCAQVRHSWELFCSLRPGTPIMALHGKLVQEKRTEIYFDFMQRPHAILFATDIAARGLDFKGVDWVVQVDAPEDRDMYIHRVGRTARYRAGGKALLMLTPSEETKGFVDLVQGKGSSKIPLKKLSINPNTAVIVTERAAALVASNTKLQELAKKAFHSYIRSIHLMPRKDIFDVNDLDADGLAKSLGLASTPNLRFLKAAPQDRAELRQNKNVNRKLQKLKEQIKAEKLLKKLKKMGKSDEEIERALRSSDDKNAEDTDDEILVSKGRSSIDENHEDLPQVDINEVTRSRNPKKIRIEGSNSNSKHIVFGDEGEGEDIHQLLVESKATAQEELVKSRETLELATDEYMKKVRERLQSNINRDKTEEQERVRLKHRKRRLQQKGEQDETIAQPKAALATAGEYDEDDSNDDRSSADDSSEVSSTSDDNNVDITAQEEMALSLIRGS